MTDDIKDALAKIYRRDDKVEPKKAFVTEKKPVIPIEEPKEEPIQKEPEKIFVKEEVKEERPHKEKKEEVFKKEPDKEPEVKIEATRQLKREKIEEPSPKIKAPSKFTVTSNPHIKDKSTVKSIMWMVVLALLPATLAGIYFFKTRAFIIILLSVVSALATEYIINKLSKRPFTLLDGSAAITGLLIALIISPSVPWWIPVLGSIFAISIGKLAFGGLGHNIFNPALAGRAFLVLSFPAIMTRWLLPDGITGATPLGILKEGGIQSVSYLDMLLGNIGGTIGETSAIALLIGAAYLLYKKVIDWKIPSFYIGSTAIIALIFGQDPIFHILSGGLLIGAFFMATDYVTTPITKTGRIIFGVGCGFLTILIRLWGGYPEGVMFAILLMNTVTPLIDRWTKPLQFGGKK
jgi:Na+-translocating ferredoxin:NAD+ oxidoreductase subunit D